MPGRLNAAKRSEQLSGRQQRWLPRQLCCCRRRLVLPSSLKSMYLRIAPAPSMLAQHAMTYVDSQSVCRSTLDPHLVGTSVMRTPASAGANSSRQPLPTRPSDHSYLAKLLWPHLDGRAKGNHGLATTMRLHPIQQVRRCWNGL